MHGRGKCCVVPYTLTQSRLKPAATESLAEPEFTSGSALAIQRRIALPLGEMPAILVPLIRLELDIGARQIGPQRIENILVLLEIADRNEQIERQLLGAFHLVAFRIH